VRQLSILRCCNSLAERSEIIIHLPLRVGSYSAQPSNDDFAELFAMDYQESPERKVRRISVAVLLAPGAVISEESLEGRLVDVAPVPFCSESRNRLWRARQQGGGIVA